MERVKYEGNLFRIVEKTQTSEIKEGEKIIRKKITWEMADRSPGVRAIIVKDNKILLNREYRYELNDWDYRLPGGKVFDTWTEYNSCKNESELWGHIYQQLGNELREEADIEMLDAEFLGKDSLGLTVRWDLYYFLVTNFDINSVFYSKEVQKSEYEFIDHYWIDGKEALSLCLSGRIHESRSAYWLMRWLQQNKVIQET